MPRNDLPKLGCFLAIPLSDEFERVRDAVRKAIKLARFKVISFDQLPASSGSISEALLAKVARSNCVVGDLTNRNPNVLYELGIAQAMGKAVFPIVQRGAFDSIPFDLRGVRAIEYDWSPHGLDELVSRVRRALKEFRSAPQKAQVVSGRRLSTPFFIEWDRLDPSDAENLCRELLSQMGLRRVDWFKGSPEIDLVAEYPRKDPDGFEFRELWLISMGRHRPIEMLLDMASSDPEMFVHHLLRSHEQFERFWSKEEAATITILLVTLGSERFGKEVEHFQEKLSRRSRKGRYPFSIRLRLWDHDYLTGLVQQFPSLGYKYFSEEARSLAKYRKEPEELYQENLVLSDRLGKTVAALEEEKNRRVRAERDSVWKDISFAAAHKIGNPIFAIETDLGPLEKRVREHRTEEAIGVVSNIRGAVEKAKCIIDQFKSLTKAQEIAPVPVLLRPILDDCCRMPQSRSVTCTVDCPDNIQVMGDPDRLPEAFDELASNALHWLDGPSGKIDIQVSLAESETLPDEVDSDTKYARVEFRDNGPGVEIENKNKIFEAFFTTYDQGTGLGLALVRRVIEGHGGFILESGVPGEGAKFEIYLPLVSDSKD